jgi:hypothetical protein
MTTAITEFLPFVAPEVLGCPQTMVKAKILEAITELCKRAPIWEYEHADIDSVEDQRDYALVPPSNALVADILDISFNEEPLSPVSVQGLKGLYANWRTETGDPLYYLRLDDSELSIVPAPDTADLVIELFVSLKPTPDTTTVENFIFNEYYNVIAAGAKFYLMSMPNQKWSNPSMASHYLGVFNSGIGAAVVKKAGGSVGAPIRVKPCV